MKEVYLKRPFKTRNADEYDLSQILTLFVNPISGLNSPFEFENNIIKGKMGSGKTMLLRANHAYHLYNLVPRIIDSQELIMPVFIRLSDFQHIKEPSEIYKAIVIKIIEELSSIYVHLQNAKEMARIHQGIKILPKQIRISQDSKLHNTIAQLSRLGSEEYIERITTKLGIDGGVKAKFLELSTKFQADKLQEFKKKPNPGIKDIEEAYKNLLEDQEGKIILLIDEAGSLDRQFFRDKNNNSFFEILMNQFRTASYIRTKIAIYPNSFQDILTETRYGDVIKLEENIIDTSGYKQFRENCLNLIKNYLTAESVHNIFPSDLLELQKENIYGDCLEQIINASDGNLRRLIQLLDGVMNVAFRQNNGEGKITLHHTIKSLSEHSYTTEQLYTEPDREFLSNIQQICKNRGTYKFQFPYMSIALNKFTAKSQEYNLIKIIEIGTGSRGNTYAFDYSYCIAHDIPTHYISNSEKINKERTLLNGRWITRTAKVSGELMKHASIVGKVRGSIDFLSDSQDAGFIKGEDKQLYYFSKSYIINEDKHKILFSGKEVRFIPAIFGENNLIAQGIEVL